jgi:hypothetical protein
MPSKQVGRFRSHRGRSGYSDGEDKNTCLCQESNSSLVCSTATSFIGQVLEHPLVHCCRINHAGEKSAIGSKLPPPPDTKYILLVSYGWGETVHLVRRPLFGLLYPAPDDDVHGAIGGMRIGRGNRNTRTKSASVPLCSPQIPYDLAWDQTRAAAVGSRRLTA